MLQSSFGRFKIIAFLEGCSFLLFAITMPLKYKFGMPGPNKVIGMAHGILFLLYIVLVIQIAIEYKWNFKKIFLSLIASLFPFGTFIAAKKVYPTPTY